MSYPKKLNVTFDLENELAEYRLRNQMDSMGAKYMKTLPNTDHLKDNKSFKASQKAKKQAEDNYYKFINANRQDT